MTNRSPALRVKAGQTPFLCYSSSPMLQHRLVVAPRSGIRRAPNKHHRIYGREYLTAAAAIGDDRIQRETQGWVSPESFTHGTSEERVNWFRRGLSAGQPAECDSLGQGGRERH